MISNKATWRGKHVDIVGRGTGQLARQVRIRYGTKSGNLRHRLVDESELELLSPVRHIVVERDETKEFTREPFKVQTIGWPEFKKN